MKKSKRWLTFILAMLTCGFVFAQDVSKYVAASKIFLVKIEAAEQNKSMPRLADPDVAQLIKTLADSHTFLDSNDFTVNEVGSLMEVCTAANKIVMSYALFDLKSQVTKQTLMPDVLTRTANQMRKNASSYHPELTLLQPFLIKCLAKEVPLITKFMKSLKKEELTEVRLSGLRQVKMGISGMFTGVVELISDPNLNPSYKMALVKTMAENVDKFRPLISIQVRQQIAKYISRLLSTTQVIYVDYFKKIQAEMTNTTCEDLCLIN